MNLQSPPMSSPSYTEAEGKAFPTVSNEHLMIIPDDHAERRKARKLRKAEEQKKREQTLLSQRLSEGSLSDAALPSSSSAYQDYSSVGPRDFYDASLMAASEAPFTVKLHRILSNPEYSHIICWLPHGRSWRVLQPKVFAQKIIPLHFRHNRISSFMRQVNGWGFRRISQGVDVNSYYHEYFLRGSPHLCLKMRRLGKNKVANSSEASDEPDFYSMGESSPSINSPTDHENVLGRSAIGGLANTGPAAALAPLVPSALSSSHLYGDVRLRALQLQRQILQQRLQQVDLTLPQSNSLLLPMARMSEASSGSSMREVLLRIQMENELLRANLFSNNGLSQRSDGGVSPLSQATFARDAYLSDLYR